jgi:hypothetical protein
MTAHEIYNKYQTAEFTAFLCHGSSAESKEEYLAWVKEWKAKYRELSGDISRLKGMRKKRKYKYCDPLLNLDNTLKRRTVVGDNPNYDRAAWMYVGRMHRFVQSLSYARREASAASWRRKLAADAEREAA